MWPVAFVQPATHPTADDRSWEKQSFWISSWSPGELSELWFSDIEDEEPELDRRKQCYLKNIISATHLM